MTNKYTRQFAARDSATSTAELLLSTAPNDTLLAIDHTDQQILASLAQVDHIFSDADGTITGEGAEEFTPDKIELIEQLTRLGVGITIVTGKPLAEVAPLRKTMPADLPISFICEKGAYDVHFDKSGAWREFILSSAEQEQAVAELRSKFAAFSQQLINQYGSNRLGFGWGGSGEHKSVLSIDIFAGPPPKNYLALRGADREVLKLKDPVLLNHVEHAITAWVKELQPGWRVVHIGNANTEITPGGIGKSEAIIESAEFADARKVLLLGDSFNDHAMFTLRDKFSSKVLTGLVLHRAASLPLVEQADFVTFGMANSNPILQAVIHARKL